MVSTNVVTGLVSQLSAWVVATPVFAVLVEASHSMVRSDGRVNVGAVVSTTMMVWVAVVALPQAVTVQARRMSFSCGQAPGTIVSTNVVTGLVSQLSA